MKVSTGKILGVLILLTLTLIWVLATSSTRDSQTDYIAQPKVQRPNDQLNGEQIGENKQLTEAHKNDDTLASFPVDIVNARSDTSTLILPLSEVQRLADDVFSSKYCSMRAPPAPGAECKKATDQAYAALTALESASANGNKDASLALARVSLLDGTDNGKLKAISVLQGIPDINGEAQLLLEYLERDVAPDSSR